MRATPPTGGTAGLECSLWRRRVGAYPRRVLGPLPTVLLRHAADRVRLAENFERVAALRVFALGPGLTRRSLERLERVGCCYGGLGLEGGMIPFNGIMSIGFSGNV